MALALAAAIAIAWAVMWRTAHRLRPPLLRLGIGPRITDYLLISWRDIASAAAAIGLLGCFELWSGRHDLGHAVSEIGLRPPAMPEQVAALSIHLFLVCYAINLGFGLVRRPLKVRPTLAAVNMMPATATESTVFALVLSPVSGVSEEIIFRGVMQWVFSVATGDPVSAVASQAVLFGLIHLYQGGLGVLRTITLGVVLGAGTLVSGSLIPAIIAHTLINAAVGMGRPTTARAP